MEVELSGGRIRAADATGSVTVGTEQWRPGEGAGWPGPADEFEPTALVLVEVGFGLARAHARAPPAAGTLD